MQRVEKAKVTRVEDQKVVGQIKKGLFVLVGFKKGDSEKDVELLAVKLSRLRVMADKENKMNLSVIDTKSKILVVSQFTLHADTSGGNRPSFINAEDPEKARKLYEFFIVSLRAKNIETETGSFGDHMEIDCVLDGPVTIIYSD
ncbi:MAG: D-tyrosyl-tRNA(Tyr) deacylase [Candidatus Woesebacteria bacterium GW2011_GWA2_40_7b]|uniref:D-tyrosyl-tRNA(Tyr) deacylase n=1 Tax=Candidatus Woesebacteria bacterium GW2011_GWA2_40_7b TaxID=1618563 RepID=A0A0G0VC15_9BACT|nr:MAG: D-tyrosyl-tRNA(Tyr) deacylase [Candidatus Woesebacteria bacterium GW2011_GWA2_40_7b]